MALYSAASIGSSGSGSGSLTSPEPLGAPDTSKTLTDNGDGTYELALSVTGKTSSLAEDVKADVYIILDTSYSMVENTVSTGETRFAVAKQAVITAGDALLGQNGKTLSSGGTIPSDAVQVSLITFNNKAEAKTFGSSKCTSSKTSFESTAGGISAPSSFTGTNWEDAFTKTAEVMSEVGRSDAQPYVIFVSDGNPTFRNTLGDYYTNQTYYLDSSYDGWVHTSSLGNSMVNDGYAVSLGRTIKPYSTENTGGTSVTVTFETTGTNAFIPDTRPDMSETSGLYGTGLDDYNWAQLNENDGNYYAVDVNTNITRCYDNAKDNARSLATNYDAEFYSIRAFGSADRMNSITRYVVTGSDTGDLPADRAFDATSKDELTGAFDSIVNQILVELMYTNVTITDGLTGLTNAEAKVGDVLSEPDFRYYKYGGNYGTADNPTDITDEVNTDWPEANRAKYDSTTGAVTWNVCSSTKPDGTDVAWADIDDYDYYRLEDGVTYVVKFRVWPDQEAYDTLTSIHNAGSTARDTAYGNLSDELKNKIYKNSDGEYVAKTDYASDQDVIDALQTIETAGETAEDTAYNNLDDTIKSQIYKDTDGNYRLYTNTDASVSYDVLKRTIEEPDTGETGLSIVDSGSDTLTNPEGMILTDTTMKVYKVWEGDTAVNRPSFITLYIYEGTGSAGTDEHLYQTITLPNPNTGADTWEYTIYISPALKITDTSGTPDSEGNYPVITLDQGHTYRVGEVESSTIYQFEGETVYPYLLDSSTVVTTNGKNSQGLTATNTIRKASIIIKKANDAESLTSEDFKYLDNAHFKLLRKVVTGTGSDGYPEYQYESYPVLDSEGNTTYPYDDFEIADGETGVTFTNLPVGEYKLVELSAPDGYVIVDKEIFFKVTWTDAGGTLVLDKYVAKTGYEDDTDVRAAIAAIYAAGTAAEQNVYNNLSDETKNKIEIDGYGEYVAKSGYESDTDVIAALTEMYTARETAKDEYYNGLSDAIKANIYVSSDVIFTSSAENGTNDTMIVKNTAGEPLPNTGSRGTIIVIILGSALIIFAVLSMAARKLRSSISGK
ncbi:MAG: VWA domain-containing protein [Eubacterium sp.]